MAKLHVHSVLCDGCNNHSWLWYCKNSHDISVFGETSCQDYMQRGAEGAKQVEPSTVPDRIGEII